MGIALLSAILHRWRMLWAEISDQPRCHGMRGIFVAEGVGVRRRPGGD